jgi:hypothetical protein
VQQQREDRQEMKLSNARIVHDSGRQYYARVVITTEVLLIHVDDLAIMDLCFRAGHIRGLNEVRQKGIELKLYYAPRSLTIHFRTDQQRARALGRLRHLSGYVTF